MLQSENSHLVLYRHYGKSHGGPTWRIDNRVVKDHILYLIVKNEFVAETNGKTFHPSTGDFFWLPPQTRHHFYVPEGNPGFTLYHIRFQLIHEQTSVYPQQNALHLMGTMELEPYFKQYLIEASTRQAHRDANLRALLTLISSTVFRKAHQSKSSLQLATGQISAIMNYVDDYLPEPISPSELAQVANLSPAYFTRLFKATFGQSPREWLKHRKIQIAAQRINESAQSISEIAYDMGYEDIAFFSRQFKQVIGKSPRAYRNQ